MPILPSKSSVLDRKEAVHLLNRLTFGYTKPQVDAIIGQTPQAAVDSLFVFGNQNPSFPLDQATSTTWVWTGTTSNNSGNTALRRILRNWWTNLMIQDTTALEKIVFFMHSHFTTKSTTVNKTEGVYHQNQLFRLFAGGNFKTLATKVCRDIAINYFLSGFSNTKNSPNENFAREFLELYTIGKGPQVGSGNYTTYTEDDVRELAKVFSGYKFDTTYMEVDADTGLLRAYIKESVHDSSDKTFSSAFQNKIITGGSTVQEIEQELSDVIEMIFNQQATANNIVKELYQFFVYPNITTEVQTNIIDPLAAEFFANGYELLPILKDLLTSQHFYDLDTFDTPVQNHIGGVISSPLNYALRLIKFFSVQFPDEQAVYPDFLLQHRYLEQHIFECGMELYEPTETAGWPAYHQEPGFDRNWISENTIVERYVFGEKIIKGKRINGGNMTLKIDIVAYLADSNNITDPYDPNIVIEDLTDYLFSHGISTDRRDLFKAFLVDPTEPDYYWGLEWSEYEVSGDDNVVRTRLESLLTAILQSPENQVH